MAKLFQVKKSFWSGVQTKGPRVKPCLANEHGMDAAGVDHFETTLIIPKGTSLLKITATGRGSRQLSLVNRFDFPGSHPMTHRRASHRKLCFLPRLKAGAFTLSIFNFCQKKI